MRVLENCECTEWVDILLRVGTSVLLLWVFAEERIGVGENLSLSLSECSFSLECLFPFIVLFMFELVFVPVCVFVCVLEFVQDCWISVLMYCFVPAWNRGFSFISLL